MIFLIEYDRQKGELVTFGKFLERERARAEDCRLQLELTLNRGGMAHEVVLLEADSEAALRQTHRRYFESIAALATPKT